MQIQQLELISNVCVLLIIAFFLGYFCRSFTWPWQRKPEERPEPHCPTVVPLLPPGVEVVLGSVHKSIDMPIRFNFFTITREDDSDPVFELGFVAAFPISLDNFRSLNGFLQAAEFATERFGPDSFDYIQCMPPRDNRDTSMYFYLKRNPDKPDVFRETSQ